MTPPIPETAGWVIAGLTALGSAVRWWLRRPAEQRSTEVDIAAKTLGYADSVLERLAKAEAKIAAQGERIDVLQQEVDTLRRRQGIDERTIAELRDYVTSLIAWLRRNGIDGYPAPPSEIALKGGS